jgi:hypothetical protein
MWNWYAFDESDVFVASAIFAGWGWSFQNPVE